MDEAPIDSGPRSRSAWPVLFVVSLGLLVAVTSFGAGILAERDLFAGGSLFTRARGIGSGNSAGPDEAAAFPRFAALKELIEDEYYYTPASPEAVATFRAQLDRGALAGLAAVGTAATPAASVDDYLRDLEYAAIHGMTADLPDDYTTFLEPVDQAPLAEQMAGEYEGIGILVDYPDGLLTIVAPIPGSPAEAAGLQPNDVIEQADGRRLNGTTKEAALDLIRGPAGTTVRLTILRPGREGALDVEIERQAITTPAVTYHPVAEGRVAWIAISIFGDKTTAQLDDALERAKEEGVAGIVLDLRNNDGGWVTSAREMIGRFVPADRGPALYEDDDPAVDNELERESIIGGGESVFELPLAVLVDGGTASAAEIVAGALQDYDRATVVGSPTFGKGSVQRVHDFDDGSSMRITVAQWLTPNKAPIPEDGLRPDLPVPDPADTATGEDPQLDRAIETVLDGAEAAASR